MMVLVLPVAAAWVCGVQDKARQGKTAAHTAHNSGAERLVARAPAPTRRRPQHPGDGAEMWHPPQPQRPAPDSRRRPARQVVCSWAGAARQRARRGGRCARKRAVRPKAQAQHRAGSVGVAHHCTALPPAASETTTPRKRSRDSSNSDSNDNNNSRQQQHVELWAAFNDFKAAYDSVPRGRL